MLLLVFNVYINEGMSLSEELAGAFSSVLRLCPLDLRRSDIRFVIPNMSSSSMSSWTSLRLAVARAPSPGAVVGRLALDPDREVVSVVVFSARGVLKAGRGAERDIAGLEVRAVRAAFVAGVREGVARSKSSPSSVSSSSAREICLFCPDEGFEICFIRTGVIFCESNPAEALVLAASARPAEIHLCSFLGLSIRPCRLEPE